MPKINAQEDGLKFAVPDFSMPQTVIENARANLAACNRQPSTTGTARLRAVLELCAAQASIDPDSLFAQPAFVAAQAATPGLDDASQAMLLTLQAKILNDIYTRRRWVYNQVSAPDKPLPDDVAKWSGRQFGIVTDSLIAKALDIAAKAPANIEVFKPCLDYSTGTLKYTPTVADFISMQGIDYLTDFEIVLPETKTKARQLCDNALAASKAPSAPFFFWAVRKDEFDSKKNALLDLYNKYSNTEDARYVLMVLCRRQFLGTYEVELASENTSDEAKKHEIRDKRIDMLETSLRDFPTWPQNAVLTNALNELKQQRLTLKADNRVVPGKPFTVYITSYRVNDATVRFYKLPKDDSQYKNGKLLSSLKYKSDKTDGSGKLQFTPPAPGQYAVVATLKDGSWTSDAIVIVRAEALDALTITNTQNNATVAVDFETGAPAAAVPVTLHHRSYRRNGKSTSSLLGKTDRDGILLFDAPAYNYGYTNYLSYKYQGYTYDFQNSLNVSKPSTSNPPQTSTIIFTDRPLYHPGDSINWAVAIANNTDGVKSVVADRNISVKIYDPNRQLNGTADVKTDAMGRANGSFATKKGGLTGSWTLEVLIDGKPDYRSAVMVSDFKLPTFYAEITSIERGVPAVGAVTVSGKATTFSGMPVIGAKVDLKVSEAQRWFRFRPSRQLGTLSASTDARGQFSIVIPAEMLAESEQPDFMLSATVTSTDASTASAEKAFTTGKPYTLAVEGLGSTHEGGRPLTFKPVAYTADNQQKNIAVEWQLVTMLKNGKTGQAIANGKIVSGQQVSTDVDELNAGTYAIVITPADTVLANASQPSTFILYNIARNEIPADAARLFVPVNEYTIADDGTARVLVGVNTDMAFVYEAVRNDSIIASVKVHRLKRGFHYLKIMVPSLTESASVQLLSTAKGKLAQKDITLKRPAPKKAEIIAESFRDRLTPGSGERWRFRIVNGKGTPMAGAAMIATMYNRAIEKIVDENWKTGFSFFKPFFSMNIEHLWSGKYSDDATSRIKWLRVKELEWPMFKFIGSEDMMLVGAVSSRQMRYAKAMSSASAMDMSNEMLAESEEVVQEDVAPAIASGESDSDASRQENADNTISSDMRIGEVLQALWMPRLTADNQGNVDIVFNVPNANGTWAFYATAWDKEAQAAYYAAECMANKPLMVQPNLPRFLRAGDKATLLSSVFNNSDNAVKADVTVEIFDIATGTVADRSTTTVDLAPKGSALASVQLTAPFDNNAVGYRVFATDGSFSDGEQSAIPVLASSQTVIESTEFYLNPTDSKPFTFTVKPAKNATLTLQYCQNPVWTVVKAMRGISAKASSTSTSIVGSLFSALAAKGVISSNPDVAMAVKQWIENPSEEALTSMLAKNENLKKLVLDQTPWVQAAASQSQRMSTLAEFLDPDKTRANIDAAVRALAELQNSDGGFAWGKWSNRSSVWCTESVLTTLGIANSLGLLEKDNKMLNDMLQPAYEYLQKEALKPDMPAYDTDLALINALLPELSTSKHAQQIIDRTVEMIESSWKKHDCSDKAYDIIILKANNRPSAENVFASLRQFAAERKGMGICFPSVNDIRSYATIIQAYSMMGAPKAEIDRLRQWIIVRAQATDDLGAYNPDYVIASLMFSGSDWTSVPVEQYVSINGQPLTIDKMESATGYFAQRIDASGSKVTVTVQPNGVTPSYGSVVSVAQRPMADIKAQSGRNLQIEKRVLVQRNGQWVETNDFALGERVRVQLTITASRTLEYVTIDDERPATFEPVDQLPGFVYDGSLAMYRENLDASTRLFVGYMPKGTYHLTYDMTASVAGTFMSGVATLQSQYAPELTAHSSSAVIEVK